jgi:testis cDNA, clone: qtsA-16859, similar to human cylicin, basic protein of sperm head cytoskeleton 1(CYLC1),
MNKKKLFIIASILAAIGLVVMLFMLPKQKTNNSAKPISTETSTSNKNDKKDNKQSDKKDSKKDDKKEDKKEDTSTTSSETTVTPTTGTSTETQNNNNSSSVNTSSTNTTPAAPEPQPIYQTIHHDEVGHWETQVIQEAYDIPVYERKIIGNQTGRIYNSLAEFDNQREDGSYHVGDVQVGTTHHDAVTQEVWVVDQAAWDQTVIVGYR